MAKRILLTDGKTLLIPGVYNVPSSTLLSLAKAEAMKYVGFDDEGFDMAMGKTAHESILNLNISVRLLREMLYQIRIEAQARKVQLPLSTNYEDGQFIFMPESCERPKLELMVVGLRQCVNDLLTAYDADVVARWGEQEDKLFAERQRLGMAR